MLKKKCNPSADIAHQHQAIRTKRTLQGVVLTAESKQPL